MLQFLCAVLSRDSALACAVLRDVNLVLKQGTVTALVGRSGAGKSTVAALLSRFYEPQIGTIKLAGRSTSSFTRGRSRSSKAAWPLPVMRPLLPLPW
jgi:ABC-type multidrug transport system fused ATPase/permease subunit